VVAGAGDPAYGALSVGVQSVARADRLLTVPAGAFHPRPQVDSAVLRLEPVPNPLVEAAEQAGFRRLVVGLFGFRRKQLGRGLRQLTGWAPDRVTATLEAAELRPDARPEVLAPTAFAALHRALVDGGWAAR
jgi:16S rRNA (adenine1518-N6/adenine1519-N6)-dimethyltransferase